MVYRLLEALPDGDPLKNKAKEKALAILESPKLEDIRILRDYFEVIKLQGWLSAINFLIITKEYGLIEAGLQRELSINNYQLSTNPKIKSSNEQVKKPEVLNGRQGKILKILTETKKAQVQDIIKQMPDVTKRTVRRDLDDLLKKGKITRIGEFNQVFYQNIDGA
mgnify:CR=1 FL=1